ncbi:bifunctional pyr operon transcriptional regulator/uracil phosphoribosyltransferase PyrR [Clostridium sp. MT-14]|uniref:Bifunctional protein PyrR n=1 Tax=Clostridium aromativorans TaxID=2836848 RepID=A0ABS8N2R1_9CLOT|nr:MULTISPECIES: bifunctional pyr operon transcriptional regulator/uracil phosphoribosyltransferase PyrR [Clostridium]KAA8676156.1 bifunctional pyr operon transcriptional regulator/uracil phosphoribosyltransferase PyrR [Clostridium sp. HV4-5-A1G]MCC9294030.1 bifunctional pyr operon transcriptional regulator/uracil phosphoribosyltransferase PyrR [Clostridium aromativorans]CAB1242326.1 transcriptional attenuator and uracil phosphoribosyltransferase activity [Clostridiaceae bacterium BL-3]
MKLKALILDKKAMDRTLTRISHEIVEKNKGTENIMLVGIKRRGYPLAERIAENIYKIEGVKLDVKCVDISLYRDDLSTLSEQPVVKEFDVTDVENKRIILVDDVIYTGRTARAAMDAIIHSGRPKLIQLAVLIDRGHRELPIRPDYVGKNIPTSREEIISVEISEIDKSDSVKIYEL